MLSKTICCSEINNNKLYALSLTSSRHSDVGYAQSLPKRQLVRITMDGDSLNNNYKSKRVDYWQRPKDPKDPMYNDTHSPKGDALYKQISRQDELEDRLISDKNTIKNVMPPQFPSAPRVIIVYDRSLSKTRHEGYASIIIVVNLGSLFMYCSD